MAELDKRIPELDPIDNPSPNAQMVLYDENTDTTYRIAYGLVNPGATDLPDQWDPDAIYDAGEIVSYSQGPGQPFQIWVSSVGANEGNIPGPGSAFWETPVGTPSVGFPSPWSAGIYTAAYVALVHNNAIYWLNPAVARPYNSTDIDAEIIAGDWISLSSTGAGTVTSVSAGNLAPVFTTVVDTATTTPALVFTLSNAAQNAFLAGPVSGGAGAPVYRSIQAADVPDLSATYQPADADLSAIAALGFTSTSFLKKTAVNTWVLDTTTYLPLSGGTLTGTLTLNADPAGALQAATKQYVDGLLVGLWDDRGTFDASVNAYPSSGGSGTAGAILKGDIWTVSVAGVLPTGQNVELGDTVRALIDAPGNTQANWAIAQNNIGYTPLSNTLNSANIFVGSAGNVAVGVAMSGEASIANTGAVTLSNAAVIGKVLTGFASGAGTVTAADSILSAIQKVDGNALDRWKLSGTSTLTGNVTIGGAFSIGFGVAPSAKLHVQGLAAATGEVLRLTDSTPTTRLTVLENGKITWASSQSGAGVLGFSATASISSSANSQTINGYDFVTTVSYGANTGVVANLFRFRDTGAANDYWTVVQNSSGGTTSQIWNSTTIYDFKNTAATSIIRNSAGAFSIRGGTTSTTRMLQFTTTVASSVNNNASFNFTGNVHDYGSAVVRANTMILNDATITSVNGSTLTYIVFDNSPGFTLGTSTVTLTGYNYNPTLTSGTFTHYAMRVQSGLSAFGQTNVPTAFMDLAASVAASSSLRIRPGTAPSAPNDGDIWYDGTDIKMRVSGTTKTFTLI